MIENIFSSPISFLENEMKTIDYLRNNLVVANNYSYLLNISENFYQKYHKSINNMLNFNFESFFDIFFCNDFRKIYFGVTINLDSKKKIRDISYYFSLCGDRDNENLMLRKFHFDFTNPDNQRNTPHPIYHIQYGGELTPIQKGYSVCGDHQIISWLSEPRLFFTPMSLAILLNIVFVEFQDETIKKICDDTYWRSIVAENENLVMKPYYSMCKEFFDKRSNGTIEHDKIFTTEYCYAD